MVIHHFNRIIRNKWIWGAIAVLFSVIFLLPDDLLGRGDTRGPDGAGKLAGETVPHAEFNDARADLFAEIRLQYGREIPLKSPQVNKMVWSRLVLLKAAKDMKLVASDEDVQAVVNQTFADPQSGAFNGDFYKNAYQRLGWSAERFEAFIRRQILLQRVLSVVDAANWRSPLEISGGVRDTTDKITVRIARFQHKNAASVKLDDASFKAYYGSHTNSFALPALKAVRYVRVPLKNVEIKMTDEELRDHFEDTSDRYGTNAFETVKAQVESDLRSVKLRTAAEEACTPLYNRVCADTSPEALAADQLAKLAKEEKLKVETSGQFSISGTKFVKGFMVDASSVLPECKDFASEVSDLDPAEPTTRYCAIAGSNAVYVVGLATNLCTQPRVLAYEEITNNASIREEALADLKEQDFKKGVDKVREAVLADLKKTAKLNPKLFGDANVSTSITFVAQSAMRTGAFPDAYSIVPAAMRLAKGELSELIQTGLPGHGVVVYVEDRQPGEDAASVLAQFKSGIQHEQERKDGGFFVLNRMVQPQVQAWCDANIVRYDVQPSDWTSMKDSADEGDSDEGEGSQD